WRSNKCIRVWVTIGTLRKVTVERVYNCVFLLLLCSCTIPHTNTWTTSIRKDSCIQIFESLQQTITICCITHLLGTGVDTKFSLCHQAFIYSLFSDGSSTCQILVRRVSTRTY